VVIFFSGFDVFFPGNFSASSFFTCYLKSPIFIALYVFLKLYMKSSIIKLEDIELSEISSIDQWRGRRRKERFGKTRALRRGFMTGCFSDSIGKWNDSRVHVIGSYE